jgi:hypothetical protein
MLHDVKANDNVQLLKWTLESKLADPGFDLDMVKLMRTIASNFLMNNPHHPEIEPFFDALSQYTHDMIIEMGTEAEGLTFYCIAEALGLSITHVILSNRDPYSTQVFSPLNEGRYPSIYIWFRTGHYDVLYSKTQYCIDTSGGPPSEGLSSLYFVKTQVPKANPAELPLSLLKFATMLFQSWEPQDPRLIEEAKVLPPMKAKSEQEILLELNNTAARVKAATADILEKLAYNQDEVHQEEEQFVQLLREVADWNSKQRCMACGKDFVTSLNYCRHACPRCLLVPLDGPSQTVGCYAYGCNEQKPVQFFTKQFRLCKYCAIPKQIETDFKSIQSEMCTSCS